MKIYIPPLRKGKIGGGWTFTRNFLDLVPENMTDNLADADIFFITGATLVTRDEFAEARRLGKKIVLRVDGVPEDWRNRGTGWSRLRDYARQADGIIYQSEFTRNTTGRLLKRENDGVVIFNGVDQRIFNTDGRKEPVKNSVLYVNFRKGEHNKRIEEVIERFRQFKLDNPKAKISFVGDFEKRQHFWNNKEWDFGLLDMRKNKEWFYHGVLSDRKKLATVMRASEYIAFPSFADPCPNTLIEAMSCGCKPLWVNDYGGQKNIVDLWDSMDWSRERMVQEYMDYFRSLLA